MRIISARINHFLSKKDLIKYDIVNALFLLSFYIPLFFAIVFHLSNEVFIFAVFLVFASLIFLFYNRIYPNARITLFENNFIIEKNHRVIYSYEYTDISKVIVITTDEYYRARVEFKINTLNEEIVAFFIDKFYFTSPRTTTDRILEVFKNSIEDVSIV